MSKKKNLEERWKSGEEEKEKWRFTLFWGSDYADCGKASSRKECVEDAIEFIRDAWFPHKVPSDEFDKYIIRFTHITTKTSRFTENLVDAALGLQIINKQNIKI